jgi:uncharacterized protein (TIGR04222 family)
MNPFNFTGPEFLLFYFIFGAGVLIILYWWFDFFQLGEKVNIRSGMNDPYKIAYLRNGELGAVEVAVFSLVDRKLLTYSSKKVQLKNKVAIDSAKRPLERALLEFFKTATPWKQALKNDSVKTACFKYHQELKAQGLLKSEQLLSMQWFVKKIVMGLFISISAIKIFIAIKRGHTNVEFLILLTIIFILLINLIGKQRLTDAGKGAMEDLTSLFSSLKLRAINLSSGGQTNEAALLAAVFGLNFIPETKFPFVRYFRPAESYKTNGYSCSSGSSYFGNSCSSSSSSCSSSGGGGGCGGCGGGGGD